MENKGVSFQIPNEYGNYLSYLLEPLPYSDYQWLIDYNEIHLLHGNELIDKPLFNDNLLTGNELYNIAKDNRYYMIFVTLMAFNKGENIQRISNYKEFIESDCKIFLTVYDCSGVIFLSKDVQLISMMYSYAQSKGYEDVNYISEKELIEGICRLS
ncbi:DUF2691 family protein [Aminipila sp.]|uniref:DUF2691 family protein n=1 Tax=Aminipila sp. TaxID=2060095 RepID=UPI00289ED2D5|nr:DUF2691 family protein [Aminipila sp.]